MVVVFRIDLILTVFWVFICRVSHGIAVIVKKLPSHQCLDWHSEDEVYSLSLSRLHQSHQNLDVKFDYLSNIRTVLALLRLTEIHKGGKQADKLFICISVYTVKLGLGVIFLIPEMMHRSVNKSSGTVLETKPDEREQFTKEHILYEKLGHCKEFHLLTRYRTQLVLFFFSCHPVSPHFCASSGAIKSFWNMNRPLSQKTFWFAIYQEKCRWF